MHTEDLIDPALKDAITNNTTKQERNQRFLSWLSSAPGKAYYVFRETLNKTKQWHMSTQLDSWGRSVKTNVQYTTYASVNAFMDNIQHC